MKGDFIVLARELSDSFVVVPAAWSARSSRGRPFPGHDLGEDDQLRLHRMTKMARSGWATPAASRVIGKLEVALHSSASGPIGRLDIEHAIMGAGPCGTDFIERHRMQREACSGHARIIAQEPLVAPAVARGTHDRRARVDALR